MNRKDFLRILSGVVATPLVPAVRTGEDSKDGQDTEDLHIEESCYDDLDCPEGYSCVDGNMRPVKTIK